MKLILQAFRKSALRDLWINIKLILYLLRSQKISLEISLYYLFLLAASFFSTIENKVIKKNESLFPLNFNREPVKKKQKTKTKTLRFLSSMKCGNIYFYKFATGSTYKQVPFWTFSQLFDSTVLTSSDTTENTIPQFARNSTETVPFRKISTSRN